MIKIGTKVELISEGLPINIPRTGWYVKDVDMENMNFLFYVVDRRDSLYDWNVTIKVNEGELKRSITIKEKLDLLEK